MEWHIFGSKKITCAFVCLSEGKYMTVTMVENATVKIYPDSLNGEKPIGQKKKKNLSSSVNEMYLF